MKENTTEAGVVENIIELITENRKAESNFVWNPYRDIAGQVKKIYTAIARADEASQFQKFVGRFRCAAGTNQICRR